MHRRPRTKAEPWSEAKPASVRTPGSLNLSVHRCPTERQPRPRTLSRRTQLAAAGCWPESLHPCLVSWPLELCPVGLAWCQVPRPLQSSSLGLISMW